MNCIPEDLILTYLDSECTLEEKIKLEQHLSACEDCKALLKEGKQEMMLLKDAFDTKSLPSPLGASFVANIRHEIEKQSKHTMQHQPKKSRKWKKTIRTIAVTAAILALIVGTAAYTSPTFATVIKNFLLNSPFVDSGAQSASQNGFTQNVHREVTDKGYTLEVAEVMADPMRIMVALRIKDPQGKFHTPMMSIDSASDDTSNTVSMTNFWGQETAHLLRMGSPRAAGFSQLEFETVQPLPETMYMNLKIGLLAIPSSSGEQKITGNWNMTVPIDMKTVQSSMRTIPIHKQSPNFDGVIFTLNQVELAPSMTNMQYGMKVTETENKRMKKQIEMMNQKHQKLASDFKSRLSLPAKIINWFISLFVDTVPSANAFDFIQIKYRITDKTGKTLIESYAISGGRPISSSDHPLQKVSEDYFTKALKSNTSLHFVLDQIIKRKLVNHDIPLSLATLSHKPVAAKINGKRFIIKNVGMNLTKTKQQDLLQIELYHDYPEPIIGRSEDWVVTDETGKVYNTILVGGSAIDAPRLELDRQILAVQGLKHRPKQLTLRLVEMDVAQKVNWETVIRK